MILDYVFLGISMELSEWGFLMVFRAMFIAETGGISSKPCFITRG